MASSIPLQLAETIQTAHINHNPSPEHDINPSTAASKKEPVTIEEKPPQSTEKLTAQQYASLFQQSFNERGKRSNSFDDDIDESVDNDGDDDDEEVPFSILRAKPRRQRHKLPPIPDLRYEQSYLQSIRDADTWWKVALITTRDQVCSLTGAFFPPSSIF